MKKQKTPDQKSQRQKEGGENHRVRRHEDTCSVHRISIDLVIFYPLGYQSTMFARYIAFFCLFAVAAGNKFLKIPIPIVTFDATFDPFPSSTATLSLYLY